MAYGKYRGRTYGKKSVAKKMAEPGCPVYKTKMSYRIGKKRKK